MGDHAFRSDRALTTLSLGKFWLVRAVYLAFVCADLNLREASDIVHCIVKHRDLHNESPCPEIDDRVTAATTIREGVQVENKRGWVYYFMNHNRVRELESQIG